MTRTLLAAPDKYRGTATAAQAAAAMRRGADRVGRLSVAFAGEPHVEHSRLTTQTIAALAERGYPVAQIAAMYDEPEVVIGEAIDLERQLAAA